MRLPYTQQTKLAKTRYEKEIEQGAISRKDLTGRFTDILEHPGFLGNKQRFATRGALASPAEVPPEQLAKGRVLSAARYRAQAAAHGIPGVTVEKAFQPGMGPVTAGSRVLSPEESGRFLRTVVKGGPLGMYRAVAGTLGAPTFVRPAVEDPTLTHAVLRHELGEAQHIMKGTPLTPFSSHAGIKPILEENLALARDPKAQETMRAIRGMHPDDTLIQRLVRQVGGTPDAPLPLGGKHEKTLAQMISRNVGNLSPKTRTTALSMALQGGDIAYLPEHLRSRLSMDKVLDEVVSPMKGAIIERSPGKIMEPLRKGFNLIRDMRRFVKKGV